ncbi:Glycerol kinase [Cymbomonas tetramitiformis]|uniref:Glycerol kinase n=1 Tax=Cymbomonas tetramitiformis TaxID=36881 RepID=A0AAE0C1B0_9CHLO|nr:Glycerol kinase [Cymbomonas tetramitiformis]
MDKSSKNLARKRKRHKNLIPLLCLIVCVVVFTISLFIEDLEAEVEGSGHDSLYTASKSQVSGSPDSMRSPQVGETPSRPRKQSTSTKAVPEHRQSESTFDSQIKAPFHVPYPFRVYVYDDVVSTLNADLQGRDSCYTPYTAAEMVIPDLVSRSSIYTTDGELADYYIVPVQCECYMTTKIQKGVDFSRAAAALNKAFQTTLDIVQSRYPYWTRTEGRDHIFIFPSERGAQILSDYNMQRIKKSIFLTGTISRSNTRFNPWKDIVIPPARGPWTSAKEALPALLHAADPMAPSRTTMLHFRGILPGHHDLNPWGIRETLAKNLRREEQVVFEEPTEKCGRNCTRREMLQARFCLCPTGGVEGWSLRIFDAVMLGCVPVLVADDVELPYEAGIDYSRFSVKILERKAAETAEEIRSIGNSAHSRKEDALRLTKQHFVWHEEWVENDAFDMLLKELLRRVRFMRNSPYRFWSMPVPTG